MYIAHGPLSYILNEKIQKKSISKLNRQEHILVMILSIIFGILPDIDLLILTMTNIPSFQHHLVFTHSLLFYISLWILLNIFLRILKRISNKRTRLALRDPLINVIQWSFLIGTVSHLLADLLFSYSRTLFPLERQFTILGSIFEKNYFASFVFTPAFATELIIVGVFVYMIYKKFLKQSKFFEICTYIFILLSTMNLVFSGYMNLNIYNKASQFINMQKVEDANYDGVIDRMDWDTRSSGMGNILEIKRGDLASFITNISNDTYLVSNSNTLKGRLAYYYGAFNSYRLISQGYVEQNLPIEPVLRKYARNKYNIQSYSMDISYPKLLYEYLLEKGRIGDFNSPGDILFVVDEEENIINIAVILNDGYIGSVFKDDKRLVLHRLEEIYTEYEGYDIKPLGVFGEE